MRGRTMRRLFPAAVLLTVAASVPSLWANAADDPKPYKVNNGVVDQFEAVRAAQERRLAGSGRTDHAHHLVVAHLHRYAVQHRRTAEEVLNHIAIGEHRHVVAGTPAAGLPRSFSDSAHSVTP